MNEWQEGGHMSNWLTLKRLSEKYGVSESTLRVWKCLGYVTSSVIENVVMLDEESVIHFWEMRKTKGLNEEYLEKLIKEKEWERDILLSKLDDELFLLRTSELHQPLFHVIIQELGQLITNDREREIFLAISSGKPISWVAANRGMTYAQAVETYSSILRRLGENPILCLANMIRKILQIFLYTILLIHVPIVFCMEKPGWRQCGNFCSTRLETDGIV